MSEKDEAAKGLEILKKAILSTVAKNSGISNSEIAKKLGLESDFKGSQSNYLSWSILGILVNEGKIATKKLGRRREFYIED
jgi:hypothetical protein